MMEEPDRWYIELNSRAIDPDIIAKLEKSFPTHRHLLANISFSDIDAANILHILPGADWPEDANMVSIGEHENSNTMVVVDKRYPPPTRNGVRTQQLDIIMRQPSEDFEVSTTCAAPPIRRDPKRRIQDQLFCLHRGSDTSSSKHTVTAVATATITDTVPKSEESAIPSVPPTAVKASSSVLPVLQRRTRRTPARLLDAVDTMMVDEGRQAQKKAPTASVSPAPTPDRDESSTTQYRRSPRTAKAVNNAVVKKEIEENTETSKSDDSASDAAPKKRGRPSLGGSVGSPPPKQSKPASRTVVARSPTRSPSPVNVVALPKRLQHVIEERVLDADRLLVCFVCKSTASDVNPLIRCKHRYTTEKLSCSTHYHDSCIKAYNAGDYNYEYIREQLGYGACPLHHCHMCFIERRKSTATKGDISPCSKCYRGFHKECLPACMDELEGVEHRLTEIDDNGEVVKRKKENGIVCPLHVVEDKLYNQSVNSRMYFNHCVECDEKGDAVNPLINCGNCLNRFHDKCCRFIICGSNSLTRAHSVLCESCILGVVFRVGEYLIGFWQHRHYPCRAIHPERFPSQLKKPGKYGARNGQAGYVSVSWEGWPDLYAVLPYRMVVSLTTGSFKVLGPLLTKADKPSYDAWEFLDNGVKVVPVPKPYFPLAPEKYDTIKTSTYKSKDAEKGVYRQEINGKECSCEEDSNGNLCGEDCETRFMVQECTEACGNKCLNRGIGRKLKHPHIEKKETPGKGCGVVATEDIPKGTFIAEYAGEILTTKEKEERMRVALESQNDEQHHYMMKLDGGRVVDCKKKGNIARFINHSCDPNCQSTAVHVPIRKIGKSDTYLIDKRIRIETIRNISKGEELSFDYSMDAYSKGSDIPVCYCGSAKCTGKLGGRVETSEDEESEEEDKEVETKKKKLTKKKSPPREQKNAVTKGKKKKVVKEEKSKKVVKEKIKKDSASNKKKVVVKENEKKKEVVVKEEEEEVMDSDHQSSVPSIPSPQVNNDVDVDIAMDFAVKQEPVEDGPKSLSRPRRVRRPPLGSQNK